MAIGPYVSGRVARPHADGSTVDLTDPANSRRHTTEQLWATLQGLGTAA